MVLDELAQWSRPVIEHCPVARAESMNSLKADSLRIETLICKQIGVNRDRLDSQIQQVDGMILIGNFSCQCEQFAPGRRGGPLLVDVATDLLGHSRFVCETVENIRRQVNHVFTSQTV